MKSKFKNKFITMVVTLIALFGMMPLPAIGATNKAPKLTFGQQGGEVVKKSNDFITETNQEGLGTVQVTAKDPDGDGIAYIKYNWDYDLNKSNPTILTYHDMVSSRTEQIKVPQTNGLHVLRICAIDQRRGVSDWIKIPFYVVDKKSDVKDSTPPLLNQENPEELPRDGVTINLKRDITIRFNDEESGIYYIAYNWSKTSDGSPVLSKYEVKTQPKNNTVICQVPEEAKPGEEWTLRVFAANSTMNEATKGFMTSNIIQFNYNVEDLEAPTITLNGEETVIVKEDENYVDEGATVVDNYDAERIIYADQNELDVVAENTYRFTTRGTYTLKYQTTDAAGHESNVVNRTIQVVGENEIVRLILPDKLNYKYGEELDLTGASIQVTSTTGEIREEEVKASMFTNFDTNRLGAFRATFSYGRESISYPYIVNDYVKDVIINVPKTKYDYKEDLDLTGATVQKIMASGAATIAAPITLDMLGEDFVFDSDVLGEKIINVNYAGKMTSFKVIVDDMSAPVITLTNGTENEGINEVTMPIDTTIDLNDYTVTDNYDDEKGITVDVVITSNNVNTAKAGVYTVVYEAADSHGNKTSKTRKVTVTIDKTELDNLLKEIEDLGLVESDYTAESWKDLEDAKNLPDDTTKDLQDKINAIKEAIKNLVKEELDTTEFDKVRAEIKDLISHKDDYTSESWKNLEDKFADSNKAKETGLQSKLDAAVETLKQAIKDLVAKEVNQDAIKAIEDVLNNENTAINYTEESIAKLQEAVNNAKAITDLQSKFDKAVEAINVSEILVAKELDTSVTDAIKAELAKLDEKAYTAASWKAINDKIAEAEAKTLQTEYNEAVKDISLESLVLIPVISDVEISTSNSNKGFAKVDDIITVTFKTNTELKLEKVNSEDADEAVSKVLLNSTLLKITKVEGEENKYQATFVMNDKCKQGDIRYSIIAVETREDATSEEKGKSGIVFDMTAPEVDFANDSEGNKIGDKTLEVKTEYSVSEKDITVSDNYTELKDLTIKVETNLDVNVVNGKDETYTATYTVTDLAGNVTTVARTIKVVDTTVPVITLNGDKVVLLELNQETPYEDAGVTVSDNYTAVENLKVEVENPVDLTNAREYTVTYTVTDENGNISTETRTVRVLDKTALKEAVAKTEELVESDYTAEAWEALQDAIAKPETTQAEVDTKTQAIENAVADLEKAENRTPLNKDELNKVIKQIKEELVKSDYTEDSWNNLALKVNEAKNATLQSVLNAKVEETKQAIKDLVAKEVNQDAIKAIEDILNNENTAINYTEESIAKLQEAVNNAKAITDLQSKFDKAVEAINVSKILVAKELDTSVTDAIKAELAKLDENAYTAASWKAINDKIAEAEAKALQTEYNEAVKDISLESLVLIPVISDVEITTSNSNKGFAKVDDTITVTFKTNTELKLEKVNSEDADEAVSKVLLNSTLLKITKVEGEENKYQATFVMNDKCKQGDIRYSIIAVETREDATSEEKGKSGIVFDMTAPTITLAEGIEKETTIQVKTEYAVSENDIVVTDEYETTTKVETDLDVNTVKDSYTVTYTVTDLAGNVSTETRTIKVVDTTKPVITLKGENPVIIEVGDQYEEAGATVTDNYDTDIQEKLSITGEVNIYVANTYTVTYTVTDNNGNTQTATREVRVLYKGALKEAVAKIEGLVESDYTAEAWEALQDALAKPETTQSEVDTKTQAIENAIADLEKAENRKELDKTELNKVVKQIKEELVKSDYTEDSWKNLATNLDAARSATLQSILNAKVEETKQAIKDLVAKEVNQDAIKAIEDVLNNENTAINYTEESIAKLQEAVNNAKAITDLQSKFDKAVEAINVSEILVAKELDTSVTDAIKAELAKLDENAYTAASWKAINDKIAEAEAKTLQTEYNEAVKDISLESLVLIPVISEAQITTSNSNKGFAKVDDTITITFKANTELKLERAESEGEDVAITQVKLNNTVGSVTKVDGEENKYQATFTMSDSYEEKELSYVITAIETREGASATEENAKSGIIFDKTAPTATFVKASEGVTAVEKETTIQVKTEYTVSANDIVVKDNHTAAKDIKVEVETDLDVNTVKDSYTVTYTVTDLAGNVSTKTRTIKVVDTEKPAITLKGENPVIIEVGDQYEEAGATVTDNYDTDIQEKLSITGEVNIYVANTYTVTYTVTDNNGNTQTVTREVRVLYKGALKEAVAKTEGLVESDYTAEAWEALQDALAKPETTQAEVDTKTQAVENSIANLSKAENRTPLVTTELEKAEKAIEGLEESDYTEESWKNLQDKLAEAKEAEKAGLQSGLNTAVEALNQAIKDLVAKEVNQDAIKAIEDVLNNENTAINYTEESIVKLQEAVNNAKAITDLQSKFDKAVEAINVSEILVAKELDTSVTDAIKAELAKLDENAYTAASWKAINDAIAEAEAKALQTEYNEAVKDISLESLVLIPVISEAQITTSNANKGFAKVDDTITVTFKTNTELKLERAESEGEDVAITEVKLNNTIGSVTKVDGEENKYQATFTMSDSYEEKELSYVITVIETREGASATEENAKSGIVFDMTAPTITLAEGIEKETTIQVKTEYAVSENDIVVTDEYETTTKVETDLDVNTVKDSYTVTYTVTDLAGNVSTETRTIKVVDTEKPAITLKGENPVIIEVGDQYEEAGATVTDNYDTDIQEKLSITGEVNIYVANTYTVTYTVTDNNGNTQTATREVRVLYKGALKEAVAKTEGLVESDYTAEAWKALQDAIAKPETTQSEVDTKTQAVENAIANLSKAENRTPLVTTELEKAEKAIEGLEESDYTAESWKNLQDKLAEAKEAEKAGLQSGVNTAVEALNQAIKDLVANPVNQDAINEVIENINNDYKESDYTPESWKELQDAIDDAKAITDLQSKFDNAVNDIKEKLENGTMLTPEVLDKTALEAIIAEVGKLDKNAYTENSWKAVGKLIADAKAQVLQSKLDEAVAKINLSDLVLKPVISNVNIETSNNNKAFAKAEDTITVTFNSNTDLDLSKTVVKLNSNIISITKVGDDYKGIFTIGEECAEGELTYDITAVETRESATSNKNGNTGITVDKTAPVIKLKDSLTNKVLFGSEYVPSKEDVFVTDANKVEIELTTNYDSKVLGNHSVVYKATDAAGNESVVLDDDNKVVGNTVSRDITVEDYAKGITVIEPSKLIYKQNEDLDVTAGVVQFVMASGTAGETLAMENSMISGFNSANPGTVTLTVSHGGFTTSFDVTILDSTKPTIILNGDNEVTVEVGTGYTEQGATVEDNMDNGLMPVITGDVDTTKVGTYYVHYNVKDTAENAADEVIRTVHVVDTTKPVVTLEGDNPQIIEAGQAYVELGAKATDNYDNAEEITSRIRINSSEVDTATPGEYEVRYIVADSSKNMSVVVKRVVKVVDTTKPVITLTGDKEVTVEVGSTYTDDGATVTDNGDKDIQSKLVTVNPVDTSVVTDYTITYNVADSNGNIADEVTRTVHVVDTTKPVIKLKGRAEVTVEVGSTYTDKGATVTDNYDTDIQEKLVVENLVDTSVVGDYTITYNVTDANNNVAEQRTRTVHVVDTTKPTIKLVGDTTSFEMIAGEDFTEPEFIVEDNYDKDCEIVKEGKFDPNAEGTYTVTYYAKDHSGNKSETGIEITIKVQAVPPVISFVVNGSATELTEGKVFRKDTEITFDKGNATLTNKTTGEVIENFKGGSLDDGEYTITAVDKSGSKTTINFVIDSTPPVVNLMSGFYDGEVTIEFADPDDVHSAILISGEGKPTEIKNQYDNGIKINKKGTYSLFVFDLHGNYTRVDFEIR